MNNKTINIYYIHIGKMFIKFSNLRVDNNENIKIIK